MNQQFSASKVGRLMTCHASANLDLAIPDWAPPVEDRTADNAANRGTSMHGIMAQIMQLARVDGKNFSDALVYITEVRSLRRFSEMVEMTAAATWLPGSPDTTADLVFYTTDEMHIIDLKTGRIPVHPEDNPQLLFYAATYGGLAPRAKGVTLHIVQPWADVMRGWFAPASVIQKFMDDVRQAHTAVAHGSTVFTPGDHCMFCPANPYGRGQRGAPLCPAVMEMLYPTVSVTVDDLELSDD